MVGLRMLTITCVRQMVHAQIHPYDQVFLFQRFAVEEFVKVNHGLVDVLRCTCTSQLLSHITFTLTKDVSHIGYTQGDLPVRYTHGTTLAPYLFVL